MTRYGNVAGSSGSVIPYFKQLASEGKPLTLTDPNMTRFYIPIEKAVESVLYALEYGKHKDLIVYKSKSATVKQIADCISNNQVVIGAVKSEKTDEALLTERELNHCHEDKITEALIERSKNREEQRHYIGEICECKNKLIHIENKLGLS